MNKLIGSLILMLSLLPLAATAADEEETPSWWAEVQVISNKNPSRALLWYEKDFTEHFGIYALAEKETDGFSQFYVGPKVMLAKWLTLGVGVGREVVPNEFSSVRKNVYLNAELGKLSIWGLLEKGASGKWDKITATYAFTDTFGAGVMHETGFGYGPRVEVNFTGKLKPQLWVAALTGRYPNDEDVVQRKTTVLVGFNINF